MHAVNFDDVRAPEFPYFGDRSDYLAEDELHRGMEFDNIDQVKHAIKRYSLKKSTDFKVYESHKATYYCKCKKLAQGCQWLVRASYRKRKDTWEITKYNGPHTCLSQKLAEDHPKLDSNMIAAEIDLMIKSDPSYKIKNIQADMLNTFGYRPSYSKAWMGKQKAIAKWFGNWEESYADLPKWLQALGQVDPNARFKIDTLNAYNDGQLMPNALVFNRLFWTFGPLRHAFKNCKQIIEVDGTHLYGQFKGTLLVACSQDGNNNIVPLAFAIVEGETADAWEFFFQNLHMHIVNNVEVAIISDRHASIITAMTRMGDRWRAYHYFCVRHIANNFVRHFHLKHLEKYVIGMGNSPTEMIYERRREKMLNKNKLYTDWLDNIPTEKWVCAYDGGRRYGHMTTNLVECMNNVYKGARSLPIRALVETTYFRSVAWFVQRSKETHARIAAGNVFSDKITERLEQIQQTAKKLEATRFTNNIAGNIVGFHVREPQTSTTFTVFLHTRYCECGQFQTMRYPCRHVMAACSKVQLDATTFVDKVYTNERVAKVYEKEFGIIGNKSLWAPYRGPKILPNYELRRDTSGRPKSTRFRNEMDNADNRRSKHCALCRESGHTQAHCPFSN